MPGNHGPSGGPMGGGIAAGGIDPIFGLALGATQTGLNNLMTIGQNRATRKWNEKMYERQRKDALSDWQMQADYNSPANQMKRLKDAGLNPHLIYGNGAESTMSSPVRSSQVEAWNPSTPQFDFGSGMSAYLDIQMKNAQMSNMEKQGTLLEVEALLKEQQTVESMARSRKIGTDTEIGKTNLEFLESSMHERIKGIKLDNEKKSADIKYTLDQNERSMLKNASDIREAWERIYTYRIGRAKTDQEIKNLKILNENLIKEGILKDWDIYARELGYIPGAPGTYNLFSTVLGNLLGSTTLDSGGSAGLVTQLYKPPKKQGKPKK